MDVNLPTQLREYLAAAWPDQTPLQVNDVSHLKSGWESDIYAFVCACGPAASRQRRDLVLRVYPGEVAYGKAGREYEALHWLYQAGYPVPQVLLLEREHSPFGRPFLVMERIPGEPMWPLLADELGRIRAGRVAQFCALFVALHRLDWRCLGSETRGADLAARQAAEPYVFIDQFLGELRWMLDRCPLPGFEPALAWLAAHRDEAPCAQPAPVHWDFHPNNILCRPDGSAAVIDWTGLAISDPRFDLAWSLLLIGTHAHETQRQAILAEYQRQWGQPLAGLDYFDVAACVRRLGSVAVSFAAGPEVMGMRAGACEAMRGQLGALSRVADLLEQRTGLRIPEFDALLAANG